MNLKEFSDKYAFKIIVITVMLGAFVYWALSHQYNLTGFIMFSTMILIAIVLMVKHPGALAEILIWGVFFGTVYALSKQEQYYFLQKFFQFEVLQYILVYFLLLIAVSLTLSQSRFYVQYIYIVMGIELYQWIRTGWGEEHGIFQLVQGTINPIWLILLGAFSVGMCRHYLKEYGWFKKVTMTALFFAGSIWTIHMIQTEDPTRILRFVVITVVFSLGASDTGKAVVKQSVKAKAKVAQLRRRKKTKAQA